MVARGHRRRDQETIMRAITAVMVAVGVFGVLAASAPARADGDDYDGGWRRHEWREHQWREQRWREHEWRERAWRAYAPPPLVYAPPGYYAPPPAYYAAPPTAYYAPPPPVYEAPGLSIGFGFR
jgi:hypothetical protein